MGKAENPSGLLETVEENQNEIPNAESTRFRGLESQGTSQYWKMAKVLKQIFSKKIIAKLGYTSMLDYYLIICEN